MYDSQPPGRRPWFGPKRFGYGLRPQTWQGWLVILAIPVVALIIMFMFVLFAALARGILS